MAKALFFSFCHNFLQRKFGLSEPKLVLTVCLLNSLMKDQCMALRKKGLRVCMLNTEGTKGLSYKLDKSSSDDDEGNIWYKLLDYITMEFSIVCLTLLFYYSI